MSSIEYISDTNTCWSVHSPHLMHTSNPSSLAKNSCSWFFSILKHKPHNLKALHKLNLTPGRISTSAFNQISCCVHNLNPYRGEFFYSNINEFFLVKIKVYHFPLTIKVRWKEFQNLDWFRSKYRLWNYVTQNHEVSWNQKLDIWCVGCNMRLPKMTRYYKLAFVWAVKS